jgi:hypothetical protein
MPNKSKDKLAKREDLPRAPKRPDSWPGTRTSYGKVSNVFDTKTKGDVPPREISGKTQAANNKPNDRVANKLEKRTVKPRKAILQEK